MTTDVQSGPAIVAGYNWSLRIEADTLAFPAGVAITGHVRRKVGDAVPLATLSTSTGEIARVDDTHIDIVIPGSASADWKAGTVVMDFVRTDVDPDAYLGFILTVPVVLPVTRGLP
jgi:hypothetical protein